MDLSDRYTTTFIQVWECSECWLSFWNRLKTPWACLHILATWSKLFPYQSIQYLRVTFLHHTELGFRCERCHGPSPISNITFLIQDRITGRSSNFKYDTIKFFYSVGRLHNFFLLFMTSCSCMHCGKRSVLFFLGGGGGLYRHIWSFRGNIKDTFCFPYTLDYTVKNCIKFLR